MIVVHMTGSPQNGYRWVQFKVFRLYSCYWLSNTIVVPKYMDILNRLEIDVRNSEIPVIVAKDFNAHSYEWVTV